MIFSGKKEIQLISVSCFGLDSVECLGNI